MITGVSAGFGRRLAALLYDAILLAALLIVFTLGWLAFTPHHVAVSRQSVGGWFYAYRAAEFALVGGYYILNWMRSGQTLGMRAWHLRAVSDQGRPLRAAPAILRFLCGALAWPPGALGVLWLYVDPQHIALHDRLSKTRVVCLARS